MTHNRATFQPLPNVDESGKILGAVEVATWKPTDTDTLSSLAVEWASLIKSGAAKLITRQSQADDTEMVLFARWDCIDLDAYIESEGEKIIQRYQSVSRCLLSGTLK